MLRFIGFIVFGVSTVVFGQSPEIIVPKEFQNAVFEEGKNYESVFKVAYSEDTTFQFSVQQGSVEGFIIQPDGQVSFTPSYEMVSRLEKKKGFQVIVKAVSAQNQTLSTLFTVQIVHKNRTPEIAELPTFFVKYNLENTFKFATDLVTDPDKDPIVFVPVSESLPEGLSFSSKGEISWLPSAFQFKKLIDSPKTIEFYVEDQPSKSQTKGQLKLQVTEMDFAPEITMIPKNTRYVSKENQNININFYLSDPNGDTDIKDFGFVTDNANVPKQTIIKNTENQYEFQWMPGYDFVKDPADSVNLSITFFVLDKTQRRSEQKLNFTIKNTLNEAELDAKYYTLYAGAIEQAWELLEQLKNKEEDLKKLYQKAKKGKKGRSIINASFGATTGLSPVISKTLERQRLISSIGGTTVLTISTLEATEVIGRSMKELIERLNYVIEKKNEIQSKGDIFARDFSLKASRRSPDFTKKLDAFEESMNLKGLVVLEMDAGFKTKNAKTDENIRKTFRDFVGDKTQNF